MNFPIVVTTSDRYLHIIPVFCYLFNKYWGGPFELVGYTKPDNLPDNCTFYSMGEQGSVNEFSDDLRLYFSMQDSRHFIWLMEDTFLRSQVNFDTLDKIRTLMTSRPKIGRFSLSPDSIKFYTQHYGYLDDAIIYRTPSNSDYRLSTQPAIWNKNYLLKWLQPDHTPWQFENLKGTLMKQPDNDFSNLALDKYNAPVMHNEGVRKRDLFQYDLTGMAEEDVEFINSL